MSNQEEKYINSSEYTSLFRKRTVHTALTVIGITIAAVLIMIALSIKTDFLYHTNIFKVKSDRSYPVHSEKMIFTGNEYRFSIESFKYEEGIITVLLDVKSNETAINSLSSENFKIVYYNRKDIESKKTAEAYALNKETNDYFSEDNACRFELKFSVYPDENTDDNVYCLRINTNSSDGIAIILCDYNT